MTKNGFSKFINLFVIVCAIVGIFFFSFTFFTIKSIKIKFLGIILIGLSISSLILSILDLLNKDIHKTNILKKIASIAGGVFLVTICLYFFHSDSSITMKLFSIIGVVFFGTGIIALMKQRLK